MFRKQTQCHISILICSVVVSLSTMITPNTWSEEGVRQDQSDLKIASTAVPMADIASEQQSGIALAHKFDPGTASLLVNGTEVLKVRSPLGGYSAQARVLNAERRLQAYLANGGSPRDIKPGEEDNQIVIRTGQTVLITVDEQTAKQAGLSQKRLAFIWTNLLRTSLGAPELSRDTSRIASRGFSPALSQLRQADTTGQEQVKAMLKGYASWYGPGFHGRRCANGERFNMHEMTAAHKSLPFNTRVRVTNDRTGRSAIVRITDRGPYAHGRIIDLSKGAAQAIGMLSSGTAPVTVEVLR